MLCRIRRIGVPILCKNSTQKGIRYFSEIHDHAHSRPSHWQKVIDEREKPGPGIPDIQTAPVDALGNKILYYGAQAFAIRSMIGVGIINGIVRNVHSLCL